MVGEGVLLPVVECSQGMPRVVLRSMEAERTGSARGA
jgi:hypothetical protein